MNFYPVTTEDGTVSLFNTEINDVYHSRIGAYKESVEKFVIPSGILDIAANKGSIRILDICFGLGYNTKAAITEVRKVNPDCKISITALENDPCVLAYSCMLSSNYIDSKANEVVNSAINRVINVDYFRSFISNDVNFTNPANSDAGIHPNKILSDTNTEGLLHNIYYQSISTSNKNTVKSSSIDTNTGFEIFIGDARTSINELNSSYDLVFHDPFTPFKLPTLWTVEFFKRIYSLLCDSGNLTTYCSAVPVRAGLIEAGFYVGSTEPVGKKSTGTFACKDRHRIIRKLSLREEGLLNTKAGIPYYDPDMNFSVLEILEYRDKLVNSSDKMTSSKFIKHFDNEKTKHK